MYQAYTDTDDAVTTADPTVLSERQVTGWQTTTSKPSSRKSSASSTANPSPTGQGDEGGTPVGAIIGGAVGGGVVLIALVVGLVIFFVKRNGKEKKTKGSQQAYTQVPPGGPDNWNNPDPRMSQYTMQQPMGSYAEYPSPPAATGYYNNDHKDVMSTSTHSIPSPHSQDYKFAQPTQDVPLQPMGHGVLPQQQGIQMPGTTMMAPQQPQHAPISELPSTSFSPTGGMPHGQNGPIYEMGSGR